MVQLKPNEIFCPGFDPSFGFFFFLPFFLAFLVLLRDPPLAVPSVACLATQLALTRKVGRRDR